MRFLQHRPPATILGTPQGRGCSHGTEQAHERTEALVGGHDHGWEEFCTTLLACGPGTFLPVRANGPRSSLGPNKAPHRRPSLGRSPSGNPPALPMLALPVPHCRSPLLGHSDLPIFLLIWIICFLPSDKTLLSIIPCFPLTATLQTYFSQTRRLLLLC